MKKKVAMLISCILVLDGLMSLSGCKNKAKKGTESDTMEESIETRTRHVSLHDVSISGIPTQIYTGKPIEVTPELRYGDEVLVKDTDYKIEMNDNLEQGKATVTIYGLGNYTGVIEQSFLIHFNDSYCDDQSHAKVTFFVEDTYRVFLNRMPTLEELTQNARELGSQNLKVYEFLESIIQSDEYTSLDIGALATAEKVYDLVGGRKMTDEEKTNYATKLQDGNVTLSSLIKEEFQLGKFQKECEDIGLESVKLKFSEEELTAALDNVCGDKWIGDPVFVDFNEDGYIEAVREACRETPEGDVFYFLYSDGIHSYEFGKATRPHHSNTFTWILENDGGVSFAVTSVWQAEDAGPEFYLSQIFKLGRTTFSTQLSRDYTKLQNPQKNSIDIEYYADGNQTDDQGNPIPPLTATLHFANGKYA